MREREKDISIHTTHTRGIKVGYTAAERDAALAKLGGRAAAAGAPPPHRDGPEKTHQFCAN